jgi:hypothetical protein
MFVYRIIRLAVASNSWGGEQLPQNYEGISKEKAARIIAAIVQHSDHPFRSYQGGVHYDLLR